MTMIGEVQVRSIEYVTTSPPIGCSLSSIKCVSRLIHDLRLDFIPDEEFDIQHRLGM